MEVQTVLENPEVFKNYNDADINLYKENVNENSTCTFTPIMINSQPLNSISELTEHLILTSASCVTSTILKTFGINCIINVAPELPENPFHEENDITYHKVSIMDTGSCRILSYFDEVADLINKIAYSGGRTLVFCVAGVSRSASMCIAYLMKYLNMSLLEAYNYVKSRRPRIKPNCGFFKQLIEYEKNLYNCNTVHMVFNEFVQMEIPDVYDSEYKFISSFSKKAKRAG